MIVAKGILIFFLTGLRVWAQECPPNYYKVSAHQRNAYLRRDGTKVSASAVEEHCRPKRVLAPPKLVFKSQKPMGWPEADEKFKDWTQEEKLSISRALKTLPKNLSHFGELNLYRSTLGSENPAVSNSENRIIVFYDSFKSHDLKSVLTHELAHFYWDSLNSRVKQDYLEAADWKLNSDKQSISLKREVIHLRDSYLGPHEDFANTVELYIADPKSLGLSPKLLNCLERFIK